MPNPKDDALEPDGKLKRKEYERELARLHVEFVKLQQWVVHKGLKVCILFEGRDGAGKGGTIKAMTERVSPRIFRVVALPAPTEREKSQMYIQRYVPAQSPDSRIAMNASWGISTLPTRFMRFLPSFCFSSSLRFRLMSPP